MVLYLSIIGIAWVIISVFNIILGAHAFNNYSTWVIVAGLLCIVYEFVVDGLFAGVVHFLPQKWFTGDKKFYKVSRKERKFYETIKIKSWKDKVWELGGLGGFRKNKLASPDSSKYFERFIIESNKGIVTHLIGMFIGFTVIFILPFKYILRITLPVAIVNLFLNILPTCILRYNIPKLEVGYVRAKRLEERQANSAEKETTEK